MTHGMSAPRRSCNFWQLRLLVLLIFFFAHVSSQGGNSSSAENAGSAGQMDVPASSGNEVNNTLALTTSAEDPKPSETDEGTKSNGEATGDAKPSTGSTEATKDTESANTTSAESDSTRSTNNSVTPAAEDTTSQTTNGSQINGSSSATASWTTQGPETSSQTENDTTNPNNTATHIFASVGCVVAAVFAATF